MPDNVFINEKNTGPFMKKLFIIAAVLVVVLTSCQSNLEHLVDAAHTRSVTQTATTMIPSEPVSTIIDISTVTPTIPAGTAIPASTLKPTITPTPEETLVSVPKDAVTIMLLGSDYRPTSGYRTDTIILVTLNRKTGALKSTMEYNFGYVPDYYMMTNMEGFKGIVDSLGGINVNAAKGLSDRCDLDWGYDGYCNVSPGQYTFDGASALWYVRARYSTSDFDRLRRAQEVMWGIFYKLMSLEGAKRIPELYDIYKNSVQTNIGLDDAVFFGSYLPGILDKPEKVKQYAITSDFTQSYRTPTGGAVQLPLMEKILPLLQQALNVQ
ncbi:MAG TPA: LCP family protein [Bellilinea sp.]|nr:LCP family protein [Bellilinea sp.]